ncbi:FmdB family zinc ribbon protein [Candidatus Endomicrobiellum agilis]|uniref:FmdB family zinc ribbon protein n=1 Tax=Candidatus Endomicrobiellum agilis TaxID=3238957 RepID=UPI00284674D0|nr:zinc ribbon domain-containing protein [Endomicrobium sp.]MDR3092829.1 zinc ribbon domain-containing protein [Endomicrobium sp.]
MPLFEFICKKCNEKFETLVFGDENTECPKCKSSKVIKQFSSFAPPTSYSSRNSTDSRSSAPVCKHKCHCGCH